MASRSKSFIFLHVDEEEQHVEISDGYMVHQWVTQGTKESIDNARRPGRGSMMRPTINEESDCLRENICVADVGDFSFLYSSMI
jgi:hypothetical protein